MMNLFDHFGIIITDDLNKKLLTNKNKMPDIVEFLIEIKTYIEAEDITPEEKITWHEFCRDKMLED